MLSLRSTYEKYRFESWLVAGGIVVLIVFAIVQRAILASGADTHPNYTYLLGVPLDDVYIHCRFAQNLLNGHSFSFNPGETLTADTSPLWVLLIAIGGLFTSHLELVAIALSAIGYLIIGPGVYRTARDVYHLDERSSRLAGIVAVLTSRLCWGAMSGMETTLAALLVLLAVEEHERQRQRGYLRMREGMWLGLGVLVRPEFLFITVALALDWIYLARTKKADTSQVIPSLASFLILASPAFLLPMLTRGSIVYHSSVVQGARTSLIPDIGFLWYAIKVFGSNNLIVCVLILAGLPLLWSRRYRMASIIALGLPIVQAFVAPQFRHHGRYLFIVLPVMVLLGIALFAELKDRWPLRLRQAVPALLVIAGLFETGRWAVLSAESVRNINDQHLAIVDWLRSNATHSNILAVDDVGAIGYFLNRHVIDLTGLMTPEIYQLHGDQEMVWNMARDHGANMFIIYNDLNRPFYEHHKDSLVLRKEFTVRLPLVSAAARTMSLYTVKGIASGN